MAAKGKIKVDRERCKGCHLCLEVCPRKRLKADSGLNKKGYQPAVFDDAGDDDKDCTGCAMCAEVCPEVAIEVYRERKK